MAMTYYSLSYSLQWLPFLIPTLILSCCVSAAQFNVPRLGPLSRGILRNPEPAAVSESFYKDLKTFFYAQTLDHFNYRPESYKTFRQRYVMNFKHWGGAKAGAPIFAYLGAEAPLDGDLVNIGFVNDNAARFNALLIYIEVRILISMVFFFFHKLVWKCLSFCCRFQGFLLDFNG